MSGESSTLKDDLLALVAEDEKVRAELAADGSLFQGYHPRMREVHERNAAALGKIIAAHGWPGFVLVGREGAAAAWRVAQHAIGMPDFQRHCLKLLGQAVVRGDADPRHAAYLDDRIAFNERRPQKYGTQFDWNEAGEMAPWMMDDRVAVDRRRATLGMKPVAEDGWSVRDAARHESMKPLRDWHARQREIEEWARVVGWIK